MADIPFDEPGELRVGDTTEWYKASADYPATDGWTLKYSLRNATAKINITAATASNGIDYLVSLTATVTGAYTPGTYIWTAYVTKGAGATLEQHTIADGREMVVIPNFSTDTVLDNRSHAKKVLDAIEAVIEGRASQDQMAYSIAGRSLSRTPIKDLLDFRRLYRNEYLREQGKAGKVVVRFNG